MVVPHPQESTPLLLDKNNKEVTQHSLGDNETGTTTQEDQLTEEEDSIDVCNKNITKKVSSKRAAAICGFVLFGLILLLAARGTTRYFVADDYILQHENQEDNDDDIPLLGVYGRDTPLDGCTSDACLSAYYATGTLARRYIYCSCILIDRKWVLTAAHCAPRTKIPKDLGVYLGGAAKSASDPYPLFDPYPLMRYNVEAVVVHPDYAKSHLINDFALLRLERRVDSAYLPAKLCSEDPAPGERLTVVGTGVGDSRIEGNDPPYGKFRFGPVWVKSLEECSRWFSENHKIGIFNGTLRTLHSSHLCYGVAPRGIHYDTGICQGDSGGPLVGDSGCVAGIVSWGVGQGYNCSYDHEVAARVSVVYDLIQCVLEACPSSLMPERCLKKIAVKCLALIDQ
uniref:Peptidase S1 domain-containing protein n=1 Tax=Grammatophora oceanica TaxID=210454 RepID=A0A7S1UNK0_9STRA|mmetsp:Transcript_14125/g.20696  ORF Transcript_14125/g.20696 Transcript_14125/m.20696 type:complete len:397 (+) Transcript_14125:37-1227(+)|eukprot:CAMPEP_0194049424 /NCGR_PEP_ID=MMETSP0009_2-20130614/30670_1 /TAXON_ID=210454 /ORGANISM="Grammatophora oceanica, Strain CCMP 410" /LENGTH=396 /DNA_ID=CAMNT_0038695585 /DNA_START=37 /DNA_END=1227 /DNA_ORIENTATION=-